MSKFTICFALLLCSGWAWADVPPNLNQTDFTQLIATTATTGMMNDMGDGTTWKTLESIVPNDTTVSRRVDYIDDVGGFASNGQFEAFELYIGWEDWVLGSDNNFAIDQWIFQMDITGNVMEADHNQLVENQDGEVLQDNMLPVDKAQSLQLLSTELTKLYTLFPNKPTGLLNALN